MPTPKLKGATKKQNARNTAPTAENAEPAPKAALR